MLQKNSNYTGCSFLDVCDYMYMYVLWFLFYNYQIHVHVSNISVIASGCLFSIRRVDMFYIDQVCIPDVLW